MIQYFIRVDLQSSRILYTDIELTSGDLSAYQLVFTFYSNGVCYPLGDHTLVIKAKRPDGQIITDRGFVTEKGQGIYLMSSNLYAVSGSLSLEVAVVGLNGEYITAKELFLQVRQGYGEETLRPENTTPILSKLMELALRAEQAVNKAETLPDVTEELCSRVTVLEENQGNIDVALDVILNMQNSLIGGDA